MKVLIMGGAGVLGSNIAEFLVESGYSVEVIDIVRPEEAWRLRDVIDSVSYIWKSAIDISRDDLKDTDIIFDCAIGSADRPFGNYSPEHTVEGNILPPLHLLEAVRRLDNKPLIIYPSSFNALYGHGQTVYSESLLPNPTSVYGWTKAAAELLYITYYRSHKVPVIVTRTSSAFGPKGRSDELPHKLIIYALNGSKSFYLRSPRAKRLWTYTKDVLGFYKKLLDHIETSRDELVGRVLHVAGNKTNRIVENITLANIIKDLTNSEMEIIEGDYEPGELVYGKPVSFNIDTSLTRKLVGWKPRYSLKGGLKETIAWFEDNLWRYAIPKG